MLMLFIIFCGNYNSEKLHGPIEVNVKSGLNMAAVHYYSIALLGAIHLEAKADMNTSHPKRVRTSGCTMYMGT